jgi:hypothetical protein
MTHLGGSDTALEHDMPVPDIPPSPLLPLSLVAICVALTLQRSVVKHSIFNLPHTPYVEDLVRRYALHSLLLLLQVRPTWISGAQYGVMEHYDDERECADSIDSDLLRDVTSGSAHWDDARTQRRSATDMFITTSYQIRPEELG